MSDGKDTLDLSALGAAVPNAAELSAEDKANLVESIKNTLQGLAARHTDVLESLEPKVRKRVEALREIQRGSLTVPKCDFCDSLMPLALDGTYNLVGTAIDKTACVTVQYFEQGDNLSQHDEFEAKFFEERAALEAKYQKMYEPLYSKRHDVVNGVVEAEGVTKDSGEAAPDEKEEKGVPDFWLNAMKNHEILAEEIQERDEEALKYLKDIKWYRITEPKGFKLEFHFNTNPFFKNEVLSKTYHMIDEDEPILEKAIGTEIEWYPGKSLTQKVLKKKPKKGSKNTKPITKIENCESFFNFFSPPQVPDDDEEIDEDTAEQLQNQMEQDYDIGSTIRDKIIPHAVSWFTGEAAQDEDFDGIMDDDEDDEEDEDEDEDDEEDEDDDDGDKKKGGRVPAGEGQAGERPAECKQQ
uniref:Nucleosome assembly protein 1-like protein 1 n=1 Tax=Aegilops tauschii TaxID=37682 RepID=M8CW38_AEGTA